ncbi:MAG: transglutaminase domain-containing protein [Faecousia sp.]
MKQKVILAALAALLFLLLATGLVLSLTHKEDAKPAPTTVETTPAVTTLEDTTPVVTTPENTTPAETTPVVTTPGDTTPGATTPAVTTPAPTTPAPTTPGATQPGHTHTYVGKVTPPTLKTEGYTTYTCACGASYIGDKTPVLTLEQHINQLPLNPGYTGVSELDSKAHSVYASADTTYKKLMAIHTFLRSCTHGPANSTLAQMSAFAGNKVFKNISELKFAYDANQIFTNRVGQSEHIAAAYAVAARNLGLESYVVSGSLNGKNHTWCQIYLGEDMYIFDAYADTDVFAKLPGEVSGYADGYIGNQSGFQSAEKFAITLTVKSDSGSSTKTYTWDIAQSGKGNGDFLQNAITMKLSGKVEYTITVTAKNGDVMIYDQSGIPQIVDTLSGTLNPAAGQYTLLVEEQASGRTFLITIDN